MSKLDEIEARLREHRPFTAGEATDPIRAANNAIFVHHAPADLAYLLRLARAIEGALGLFYLAMKDEIDALESEGGR